MSTFRCRRFPRGVAHIRTSAGVVDFHDGQAVVDDPKLIAGLREQPTVFGIEEEGDQPKSEPKPTNAEIRKWAGENDVDCPAKGRIPTSVVEAYHAAMK